MLLEPLQTGGVVDAESKWVSGDGRMGRGVGGPGESPASRNKLIASNHTIARSANAASQTVLCWLSAHSHQNSGSTALRPSVIVVDRHAGCTSAELKCQGLLQWDAYRYAVCFLRNGISMNSMQPVSLLSPRDPDR